ncbi:hypothetical protein FNJ59_00005 [Bacteroides pyogenes]|uniref:Uncharacterized protein n=1 Tax=Bacteroides pyogenes TaxID=310300 RepID=A0A5D3EH05_9BACE|nr:hypothetical protein FNJ60_00005 [Bacteroides pyogenes]TYK42200.1 hypothetical protein FNJ59_00005 [Bacteroides pyogenes]TYK51781.1 hypothetical protein FNG97_01495 [Bacteroides pyogenes]
MYYLYCLSICQRTWIDFLFKSGCKGKRFISNRQILKEVFSAFLFGSPVKLSVRKIKTTQIKKKREKNPSFAARTVKISILFP